MVFTFKQKLKFLTPFIGLFFSSAFAQANVSIEGARLWDSQERTRVVLETSGPVDYTLFTLNHPNRVVIDINNAQLSHDWQSMEYKNSLVHRIRTGSQADALRIVLDLDRYRLGKGLKSESFSLKPEGPHGHRLVVDLYPKQSRNNVVVKKPVASPVIQHARVESKIPVVTKSPIKKSPIKQDRVKNFSAKKTPVKKVVAKKIKKPTFQVAIDAGHGGEDPGAKGRRGTLEKVVVLRIAKRLKKLIDRQPGMSAYLIRKGDYRLSLGERLNLTRKKIPDLFISIHADAAPNKKARGATVYTLSNKGAAQAADRWLDDRANGNQLADIDDWHKKDPLLRQVILDLSQTATLEASQALADYVLFSLKRSVPIHAHKTKKAAYAVLKAPDVPSILVETAFLSNVHDERRLRSKKFQAKLAKAIFRGVRNYYSHYPHSGPNKQHVISRGETLSSIAEQYQVNLQHLKEHNRIKGDMLRPGDVIHLP